jgi:hypothetical protein
MPVKCYGCSKTSSGKMPTATIEGQERSYCADCYWKLEKEYLKKKTCEECAYFSKDRCKKTDVSLTPVTVGFSTYFVQAENCNYFSEEKEAFLEQAKKLEAQGKHEEAADEYEKLGMIAQAEEIRKKLPKSSSAMNPNSEIKNLTKKGQTLTYYCCHCGAPLKIGAKSPQIQKTCPRCKGDLEVINLSKLIKQHS